MEDLKEIVLKAASEMSKKLVELDYILQTSEEAKAFLTYFLIKKLGEKRLYMLYLNRVPSLGLKEDRKKYPDIVLFGKDNAVFIKVKLLPRGLKARHARERIWGRKRRSGEERVYGIPDHARKFKKISQLIPKKTLVYFVIFDEKNYLNKENLVELEKKVKDVDPNFRILHYNLRRLRELKQRGLLTSL
ncbi:MAG: hypothetical protein DRJ51_00080 [Thermoprotei archaeon]|nr:MAG: hypothetical protein DRJ51_00080 [Thermoprotei archaeon]RLF03519.1 MAG: hypothetical protein DRJ59_00410 [Thermoprotei archaeon]